MQRALDWYWVGFLPSRDYKRFYPSPTIKSSQDIISKIRKRKITCQGTRGNKQGVFTESTRGIHRNGDHKSEKRVLWPA
jgi:hypothetical protein